MKQEKLINTFDNSRASQFNSKDTSMEIDPQKKR